MPLPPILSSPSRLPPEGRRAFQRDLLAIAARSVFFTLLVSVGPQLVQTLGGGSAHVAAVRSATAAGLLLSLGWVALGRGRSPLRMILWPVVVSRGLLCTIFFAGALDGPFSPATLFTAIAFLSHAIGGLSLPFVSTVYGLVYPPRERAGLVALGRMLAGLVAVVAAWGFGRLFQHDPTAYRWTYPLVALVGIVVTVHFCTMPVRAARRPQSHDSRSAWQVLRSDRSFRNFQFFQFVLGFANLGALPLIDLYVRQDLGMPIGAAVFVVGGGVIAQTMTLLTVGSHARLFDWMGVVRHRVATSCVIGLSMLAWAFAETGWHAALAAGLAGLGMAGGQLIWIIGSLDFAPRDELSTYSGIHTFLTGVRGLLAPAGAIWLLESEWAGGAHRPLFLLAAVLVFVSAAGHHFFVREPTQDRSREAAPIGG